MKEYEGLQPDDIVVNGSEQNLKVRFFICMYNHCFYIYISESMMVTGAECNVFQTLERVTVIGG